MTNITKIEHTAIIVSDIDRSIEYYHNMFGFELRTKGRNNIREMAFIYLPNDPGLEIELIRDLIPSEQYSDKGVVNHLAFRVENIQRSILFYKEKGIEFLSDEPKQAIDGGKTIFFYGPDRELLQIVEPSPIRMKRSNEGF